MINYSEFSSHRYENEQILNSTDEASCSLSKVYRQLCLNRYHNLNVYELRKELTIAVTALETLAHQLDDLEVKQTIHFNS